MVPCIANNITNVSYWVHVRWFLLACFATVGTWELVLVSKPLCVSTLTSLWLFYSLSVSWKAFRNLASVFLSSIWLHTQNGDCKLVSVCVVVSVFCQSFLQHLLRWFFFYNMQLSENSTPMFVRTRKTFLSQKSQIVVSLIIMFCS